MDSYRGHFSDHDSGYDPLDIGVDPFDTGRHDSPCLDDLIDHEPPPSPVGQDERRMQVRAYNFWASLLGNRNFPAITDLETEQMPELAPYSVILNFEQGIENPGIAFLGENIAEECGAEQSIRQLSDIPGRSLLSRITDHYMQILANEAPIGFEAEFVNQRGKTIAYRGILLPFSSNGESIQHILGVINWKELADQAATDALNAEVAGALAQPGKLARNCEPLPVWADGPANLDADLASGMTEHDTADFPRESVVVDFSGCGDLPFPLAELPAPAFGQLDAAGCLNAAEADESQDLAGLLAAARALAGAATGSEDRTRAALYAAIGRAWDFALAAAGAPVEFAALVTGAGLAVQERAPMTPVVKLVFGADYDKTRLTEYASALAYAHRIRLARGTLAKHLALAPGGLKAVVREERRLKRAATASTANERGSPRETLARKLRSLPPRRFDSVATGSSEFAVLLARRLETGEIVLLGEVCEDAALLERAARRLLA